MRRFISSWAMIGLMLLPGLALAQGTPGGPSVGSYTNASAATSTTPTQVFAAAIRSRIKLINMSGIGTTGGTAIVIWCRWNAAAAAGGVGSFALQANGGGIDDNGTGVNQGSLSCVAESGTPLLYAEQY